MGKSKPAKEKKFDRNVEISAPILDPEIIKAIHSPPRGHRLDLKHGGFKALLSDMNSQDSTDEVSPLNENHVPSYIGISCAVSGYSNYSSYTKRSSTSPISRPENNNNSVATLSPNRSRTTSPTLIRSHHSDHVHHIKVDKNNIQSPDEERKELTEKMLASASEHRRSPSPIPPTEDDRHHGTYVGARYCPLPPPSKVINKHIPLLGIDDDQDPDEYVDENQVNKVEQKIANLYGDEFVEDWRESMTHKAKKELPEDYGGGDQQSAVKNPKDLVSLKPTPPAKLDENSGLIEDVPTPSAKVLASVEKQFLNKLLTDENPPTPSPPPYLFSGGLARQGTPSPVNSPDHEKPMASNQQVSPTPPPSPEPLLARETIDERLDLNLSKEDPIPSAGEEHIEYEIRAQSPIDNEASPVRIRSLEPEVAQEQQSAIEENLVISTSEPPTTNKQLAKVLEEDEREETESTQDQEQSPVESENNDGRYYLNLLDKEKSFILSRVAEAEAILSAEEAELDEDTTGRIRSAIGKANLLVNKKCNQFKELCESNINANTNQQYATLNDDLAGFWDMIRIQIDDVKRSFESIWIAKANNWDTSAVTTKTTPIDSGDDESKESSLKDRVSKPKLSAQKDQERRERLKEHINQMKQHQTTKSETVVLLGETEAEPKSELDQVGLSTLETVVASGKSDLEDSTTNNEQSIDEAEEQLFSLMGSTSPPPPTSDEIEAQNTEKPSEDIVDLLG